MYPIIYGMNNAALKSYSEKSCKTLMFWMFLGLNRCNFFGSYYKTNLPLAFKLYENQVGLGR